MTTISLTWGHSWSETLLVYLEDYNPIEESTIATSGSSVCLYRFDPHGLVRVAPVLNIATILRRQKLWQKCFSEYAHVTRYGYPCC